MDAVRANICKGIKTRDRKLLKRNRFLMLRGNEDLPANQGKALQGIFKEYPELENLYLLKEAFRDIYRDANSSAEAIKMFDEWCDACEDCGTHAYDGFIQMVLTWKNEIFAYFDYPDLERTNAQTESLNRAIRTIARNGRGYKFDILRKKVILSRYRFEQEERFSFSDFFDE